MEEAGGTKGGGNYDISFQFLNKQNVIYRQRIFKVKKNALTQHYQIRNLENVID